MWDPGWTDKNQDHKAVALYCAKIKRKKRKEHQKKKHASVQLTHSHKPPQSGTTASCSILVIQSISSAKYLPSSCATTHSGEKQAAQ